MRKSINTCNLNFIDKKHSFKLQQNWISKKFSMLNNTTNYFSNSNPNTKFQFIKSHYKINDLKYKEEIFEYFSYNYQKMKEEDFINIFEKLFSYYILEQEVKYFKFIMRDFLEIANSSLDKEGNLITKFNDENLISSWVRFFNRKFKEIKPLLENNMNVENTEFDRDFTNILNGQFAFLKAHAKYITSNENLFEFFKFIHENPTDEKSFSNELWCNLIEIFKNNKTFSFANKKIISFEKLAEINLYLLINIHENFIVDKNKIKYFLNNFLISMKFDYTKENITEKEMEFLEQIYLISGDIVDKINHSKDTIKLDLKEFFLLKDELKLILHSKNVDFEKLYRIYKLRKQEGQEHKILSDEFEEKLKVLDSLNIKYM